MKLVNLFPKVHVKAKLGNQVLRTRISQSQSIHPVWNEDMMFVTAEPFEEELLFRVDDLDMPNKNEVLGWCRIPLQYVDWRLDQEPVNSRWWVSCPRRISYYNSDLRPTATQMGKHHISVMELGILMAQGLQPMKTKDGRRTTDAYCVAKYGKKWVRTKDNIRQLYANVERAVRLGSLRSLHHGSYRVHARDGVSNVEHTSNQGKLFSDDGSPGQADGTLETVRPDMQLEEPNDDSSGSCGVDHASMIFVFLLLIGGWGNRRRLRMPMHMDTRFAYTDAHPDEIDEEFDTFPTSRDLEVVRMRYDRLRSITGRIHTMVGNLATQGDRLQSLLSWRDPRATALFLIFRMVAAMVMYLTPFRVVLLLAGLYSLRHPRFRQKRPSVSLNFFRRLPARTHCMLWNNN
ncbi:hypothetical protein MLD38_020985 [Melastoma candidum]|uniref:Uncharacterized protein n=1 Tax=Melastoma candidum TaxID=119954 RepID=A0ACB9QIH7_9MYRT|nr:hypothetical protein MLD38_020985 [Melastoma candidum]